MQAGQIEAVVEASAKQQPSRKWLFIFLAAFFVVQAVPLTINYIVDPFQLFHFSGIYSTSRDNQRTSYAGTIRTAPPFDAVVIGSSYVGNFDPDLIERLFGVRTRVFSTFGATQKELSLTLAYLLARRPEIKAVFLEASVWNLCNGGFHPTWKFPEGLYEDDLKARLQYLTSGATLEASGRKIGFLLGLGGPFSRDAKMSHRWIDAQRGNFNNPKYMTSILRSEAPKTKPNQPRVSDIEATAKGVAGCFQRWILPYVQAHPKTTFYVFNPPVIQQLLWYRENLGLISAWMSAEEMIAEEFRQPNLKVFDFYADKEVVNDCTRFMDIAHFDEATGDRIVKLMHEGKFERTKQTDAAISALAKSDLNERHPCALEE